MWKIPFISLMSQLCTAKINTRTSTDCGPKMGGIHYMWDTSYHNLGNWWISGRSHWKTGKYFITLNDMATWYNWLCQYNPVIMSTCSNVVFDMNIYLCSATRGLRDKLVWLWLLTKSSTATCSWEISDLWWSRGHYEHAWILSMMNVNIDMEFI